MPSSTFSDGAAPTWVLLFPHTIMTAIARIKLKRISGGDDVETRVRWLQRFCLLDALDVDVLEMLARGPAPDPDGWPLAELADRLGASEYALVDRLHPGAPLVHWGLVRLAIAPPARISLNERIEHFLFHGTVTSYP